jgi:Putative zinc-finger
MVDTPHFKEELQELLDNRLSGATRLEIEKHLAVCEECRRELRALSWAKELSRQHYEVDSTPDRFQQGILAALDREDLSQRDKAGPLGNWWTSRKAIFVYSLLLVTTVGLILFYFVLRKPTGKQPELGQQPTPGKKEGLPSGPHSREDLPSAVANDYISYKAGGLPLMLTTQHVKQMEKFFSENGIPFQTRVFDLGMMNYRLLGGRVHKLGTRQSAFFVYRGKDNAILVCQMYPGQITELPSEAVEREHKGIRFYAYRVKEMTLTFWQEGAITCVLASDIDPEEVVQLAFAKAIKV